MILLCSGMLHFAYAQQVIFDWVNTFGSSNLDYTTSSSAFSTIGPKRHVVTDDSGNVYTVFVMVGVGGDVTIGNTRYYSDSGGHVLAKFDDAGNVVWSRQIGIPMNYGLSKVKSIAVDKERNIIIAGSFRDDIYFDKYGQAPSTRSGFLDDGFIAKYDKEGNYLWSHHLRGLISSDEVTSIMTDDDGFVYAAGKFSTNVSLAGTSFTLSSTNSPTGYILKLSASGSPVWIKSFDDRVEANQITKGNNGDFYLTGQFFTNRPVDFDLSTGVADTFMLRSDGRPRAFLARYNADGNIYWAKGMGGKKDAEARSVAIDIEGNAYVGGYFQDTAYFGKDTMISTVYNYLLLGQYPWQSFKNDQFISKLDSSGNFLWTRQFRTTDAPSGTLNFVAEVAVHPTVNNGVYAGWTLGDTTDFDPGPGEHFVSANPGSPTYRAVLLKLASDGNLEWVRPFTGNQTIMGNIAVDKRGSIFSVGRFGKSVDFDPDNGGVLITPKGTVDGDAFIHKMICTDTNSATVSYTRSCTGLALNGDTFMVSGTYTQTLTNHLGCDSVLTIHLTIELPEAIINVNGFVLSTTKKFATYKWMLNGKLLEGQTDAQLTVSENGNYQVIVTDESGCADTSKIYVVDNVNIESVSSLQEQVSIYPNPVSQMLRVYSPVPVDLYLTGVEGRILLEGNNTTMLDLGSLSDGVYLLHIKDKKGRLIKTEKIVKQ